MMILICNVGSTSLKWKLFEMDGERILAAGDIEEVGAARSSMRHWTDGSTEVAGEIEAPDQEAAVQAMLGFLLDAKNGAITTLSEVAAVGFKVVGARDLTGAVRLDEAVLGRMEEFNALLPRHNPPYIAAIRIFQKLIPETPLVGLFETAFHRDIPDYAYIYSVPYEWYERHGVRRYGYHGASLRYLSERTPQILGRPVEGLRVIACHLGGSSSVCAIRDGVSVDTSMGMSAQAGIPMSTRCGDIDPFIIPHVMDREGLSTDAIRDILTRNGGLAGISGLSGDMRNIETAALAGDRKAELALASFAYTVKKHIGAYAAVLGGVDALVFAGGIGENGIAMRERICEGLEFLGIHIDPTLNDTRGNEAVISPQGAPVSVLVVPTNEEIIVARETQTVLMD